ncbi:MAG: signal peptidase II [Anaerolineae bacterium]|nr:signal peptidase II [Anaerolineae bacterium]
MKGELPISKPITPSLSQTGGPLPTIIGVAAITFALDQATKFLVVKNIPLWGSWSLYPALDRLFKLTFITNTGAAFGMFPQMGTLFMGIAFIVIAGIIAFHHQLPTENIWIRISLGLQLGGAMGNLLDRFVRGYVVDFVDVGFWPIFNIADIAIVLGVTILAYHLWNVDDHPDSTSPDSSLSKGNSL